MATTMTLSQLQTAVVQRADMVNSQFIDQTIGGELTSYVNQSYFELYDLLVSKYGNNYFVQTPYQFVTDGINDQYALPADFYKLLGVDVSISPSTGPSNQSNWFTLKPFNMEERNMFSVPGTQGIFYGRTLRYRINGNFLWFKPFPAANQYIQLYYVPLWTPLVIGADTVQNVSGWLEYIIIDAAIKCLQKEESDVTVLALQKGEMIKRIEAMAENRDAGSPATVSNSQDANLWNPDSGGGYGDNY